jgi:hypothetical protein
MYADGLGLGLSQDIIIGIHEVLTEFLVSGSFKRSKDMMSGCGPMSIIVQNLTEHSLGLANQSMR